MLGDKDLVEDCGMSDGDVRRFRAALNQGGGGGYNKPASPAAETVAAASEAAPVHELDAHEIEEAKIIELLSQAGLKAFAPAIFEFGVETLHDLGDPDVLSDEDLVEDCGMSDGDVQQFREALLKHTSERAGMRASSFEA